MDEAANYDDITRNVWMQRMVELMIEARDAGTDPYEVLHIAAMMGYTSTDLIAVSCLYESAQEASEDEEQTILTAGEQLVAEVEAYLQMQS